MRMPQLLNHIRIIIDVPTWYSERCESEHDITTNVFGNLDPPGHPGHRIHSSGVVRCVMNPKMKV